MTAGDWPRAFNRATMDMATGVLPAPPTVRLPMLMTGTLARSGLALRTRRAVMEPTSRPMGLSRRATPLSVRQNSGGRMAVPIAGVFGGGGRSNGCRADGAVGFGRDANEFVLELLPVSRHVLRRGVAR